jgi:diguanylate cyclase (GGDEF)-like protein
VKEGLTPSKIDQLLLKLKPHPVVALVDDDLPTLDLLERALHDEGYEVRRFLNAEELLEKHSTFRPDVIVMDAVLPGMSGLSALDELRPKSPEESIPVLIFSDNNDLRAKLLAFRRGAHDYVIRPFEAEEVAARVRSLVRNRILHQMLQITSISDPLTSLYNRRFLSVWLDQELHRIKRYGLDLSCLMMDLDNFKSINEENGERYGDFILSTFAKVVSKNIRGSDIVGRMDNDEFAVFLPGTSKEEAMIVARRLRHSAAGQDFGLNGKKVNPTFCIGITDYHSSENTHANAVFERAREALEKAKSVGTGETAVLSTAS